MKLLSSDDMPIGVLLEDFGSIKLLNNNRQYINSCKKRLQAVGFLPVNDRVKLRALARRYSRQFTSLYEARAKGRRTMSLKRLNLKQRDVEVLKNKRVEDKIKLKNDMGF